eukprot:822065-Ditylum_brightwellii.AAC.1
MYQLFLGVTAMLVIESRNFYTKLAGNCIPFITVAHNIWDLTKKELLACGLMMVKNKTAQQVSSNTYVILNRVSVEKED